VRYILDRDKPAGNKPAPWKFLFGTVVWTWLFLSLTFLTGQNYLQFPTVLLSITAGLGPLFISVILIKLGYWDQKLDKTPLKFLARVLSPLNLKINWYFNVIMLVLILRLGPVIFNTLFLESGKIFNPGLIIFILIGIIFGGLEEIGWRAYALEGLQRQLPVIIASLIIGIFWALWHLPLFFMEGTYQAQLGVGTLSFWAFHIGIIVGSPIYAWLYNKCGRVAFVVVLYHALGNLGGELFADAPACISIGLEMIVALILIASSWELMKNEVR